MKKLWKEGLDVICIDNRGMEEKLTLGQSYKVTKVYDYNVDYIEVGYIPGHRTPTEISGANGFFADRFTSIKEERKKKISKLNNLSK